MAERGADGLKNQLQALHRRILPSKNVSNSWKKRTASASAIEVKGGCFLLHGTLGLLEELRGEVDMFRGKSSQNLVQAFS
ncbi:hypothetical protein [Nitrosomonas sp. H1_AOB3]|uniref:hypothetical protein n=1 Tax=Nitrosomonas sp. H1_AOB3 TaxID=2741553 RepID=UPI001938100B|nr:hypothetical protein [Nitrosomonas sp. H1_AOB3]QOJ08020.1 MAG: hypothetical protein HRU73_00015 [Nitrosomonas sp. H1_AOB3]